MNRTKNLSLIAIAGAATLILTVISGSGSNFNGFIGANSTCEHSGNHYSEHKATVDDSGNLEYWVCCKCHQKFLEKPNNLNWNDVDTNPYLMVDSDKILLEETGFDKKTIIPSFRKTEFTYKIGNKNPFNINSVFKNKSIINASFIASTGTDDFSLSNTKLTEMKFSGVGSGKLTVELSNSESLSIDIDVVDAYNATGLSGETTQNTVLLNGFNFTNTSYKISNGATLYCNGYEFRVDGNGSGLATGYMGSGYFEISNGARIDNAVIKAKIFDKGYMFANEVKDKSNLDRTDGEKEYYKYQFNAIRISGNDSTVSNCYIEGARNNIYIDNGKNITLKNVYCVSGSLSNINIACDNSSSIILDNVSTSQYVREGSFSGTKVYGFGILVGSDSLFSNPKIVVKNGLDMRNWITQDEGHNVKSNDLTVDAIDGAFAANSGLFKLTINEDSYVNPGIVFFNNFDTDLEFDPITAAYFCEPTQLSISGVTGKISTINNLNLNDEKVAYIENQIGNMLEIVRSYDLLTTQYLYINNEYKNETSRQNFYNYSYVIEKQIDNLNYSFDFKTLKVFTNNTYISEFDIIFDGVEFSNDSVNIDFSLDALLIEQTYQFSYLSEGQTYYFSIKFSISREKIDDPVFAADNNYVIEYVYVSTSDTSSDWSIAYNPLSGIKITYFSISQSKKIDLALSEITNIEDHCFIEGGNINLSYDGFILKMETTALKTDKGNFVSIIDNKIYVSTTGLVSSGTSSRSITVTYSLYNSTEDNKPATYSTSNAISKPVENKSLAYNVTSLKNGKLDSFTYKSKNSSCVSKQSFITMADGTSKRVDSVKAGDMLLSYNFFTGKYEATKLALIVNHGHDYYKVANLTFDNNEHLEIIADHGVFDCDLNQFVYLTCDNFKDYINHNFAYTDDCQVTKKAKLVRGYVETRYIEAFSLTSEKNMNVIANSFLTVAPPKDFYNWIEMGDFMRYDLNKFSDDLAKYGLYDYSVFENYVTYDQYMAFNGPYLKIPVEKGIFSFEELIDLIIEYMPYMTI